MRKRKDTLSVVGYLRNFRGMSMEALADAAGVKYLTVFNAEHRKSMSLGSLQAIAGCLGVSLDCLARGDLAAAVSQLYCPAIRANNMKQVLRERQRKRNEIGDRGERLVVERERERLADTQFAMAVNGTASDDVSAGFDVLSFDAEAGTPIYIEVKTTCGDERTPFYLSRGELEFLQTCADNGDDYQLHRIFNLDDSGRYDMQILTADDVIKDYELVPVTYQVRRRVE